MAHPKFGDNEITLGYQQKLEKDTEEKFLSFISENERKKRDFIVSFTPLRDALTFCPEKKKF